MQIFWNSIKYVSIMTNNDEETEKILDIFKEHGINGDYIREHVGLEIYGYPCSLSYNRENNRVSWMNNGGIRINDLNEVYIIS